MMVPISTGAAAVFPYSADLARRWVTTSRFDNEPICLYRVLGLGDDKKLLLPRESFQVGAEDRRVDGLKVTYNSVFKPRNDEQSRVIGQATKYLLDGKSFLVEAPTGFGKTACAMQLIANVGRKTMVIIDNEKLRDQWIDAAKKFLGLSNSDIGVVQGNTCSVSGKKLVIGMMQSLSKPGRYPMRLFNDFGLVIWDEIQILGADQFSNTVWMFPAKLRLGLSATPYRADGKDIVFYSHIGRVLVKAQQMKLVPKVLVRETGWRVPVVYWNGRMQPIPHAPGKTMHVNKLLGTDSKRNAEIVQFVVSAYRKGRKTIVFSDIKNHLEILESSLIAHGVKLADIGMYIGGLKKEVRDHAETKRVLLATYAFAKKGMDVPDLDTLVLGMPKSDVIQIVGRIMREHPTKQQPLVLDLVDSSSSVFNGYASKRRSWYNRIGAEVEVL